jgi:hypothetical protein
MIVNIGMMELVKKIHYANYHLNPGGQIGANYEMEIN